MVAEVYVEEEDLEGVVRLGDWVRMDGGWGGYHCVGGEGRWWRRVWG